MILNIDPIKSALASFASAAVGTAASITITTADMFQYTAWTVATIAGLVSAFNGLIKINEYFSNRKLKKNADN